MSFFRIESHPRLGSTNDRALAHARAGAAEGLVVVAEEQTAGRGRHGRRWHSPPGNLHASLLLRPDRPLARCCQLAPLTGLALRRALAARAPATGADLRLKWPNDLLLAGGKLAGVLVEAAGDHGRDGVVVGIGVNLRHRPRGLDRPTAALAEHGILLTPADLLAALEPVFLDLYRRWLAEGFAALLDAYRRALAGLGRPAAVRQAGGEIRGILRDVDAEGAALLEVGGRLVRVIAGEFVAGG